MYTPDDIKDIQTTKANLLIAFVRKCKLKNSDWINSEIFHRHNHQCDGHDDYDCDQPVCRILLELEILRYFLDLKNI